MVISVTIQLQTEDHRATLLFVLITTIESFLREIFRTFYREIGEKSGIIGCCFYRNSR